LTTPDAVAPTGAAGHTRGARGASRSRGPAPDGPVARALRRSRSTILDQEGAHAVPLSLWESRSLPVVSGRVYRVRWGLLSLVYRGPGIGHLLRWLRRVSPVRLRWVAEDRRPWDRITPATDHHAGSGDSRDAVTAAAKNLPTW